jgi:CBS domain-containing protein
MQNRPTTEKGPAMTTAREMMNPGVDCIGAHDSIADAARKMKDLDVGALPICGDDDKLQGILTDRDIVVKCIAAGKDPASCEARELAEGAPVWVDASADGDEVLKSLTSNQIKRVPVIENNRLVGMISEADLARHLSDDEVSTFVEKVYGRS